MPERHQPYTASYLILQKGDKVLLLKRKSTGFRDGKYGLVAGHVDEGENFREAMVREAKEEVGVELEKEDLETVTIMHRRSEERDYIDIFFRVKDWKGEIENREPEKCADLSWFSKDEPPENTIEYVEEAIKSLDEGLTYEEVGW